MIDIDNEKAEILRDHLLIVREVPYPFVEAEFYGGHVYINQEMTPELEAEGYSRELMRKVQSFRKDKSLQKTDKIDLYIRTDSKLVAMLEPLKDQIQQKCGAKKLTISDQPSKKKYKNTALGKVKDFKFNIEFDKV